jgi:hypothetical protein
MSPGQPLWHIQLRLPLGTHDQIKAIAAERKTTIRGVQTSAVEALLSRRADRKTIRYRPVPMEHEISAMYLPESLRPQVLAAVRQDRITIGTFGLTALLEYLERLPSPPKGQPPHTRRSDKRSNTFLVILEPRLHDQMRALATARGVQLQEVYSEAFEKLLAQRETRPDIRYLASTTHGVRTLIATRPALREAIAALAARDRVTKVAVITTAVINYLEEQAAAGQRPETPPDADM